MKIIANNSVQTNPLRYYKPMKTKNITANKDYGCIYLNTIGAYADGIAGVTREDALAAAKALGWATLRLDQF